MLVLSYYMLITCLSIIAFTLLVTSESSFTREVVEYFGCESEGIKPGKTCRRDFERYIFGIFLAVDLAVFALYPLYSLIFVINFREVKKFFFRHCFSASQAETNRSTISETIPKPTELKNLS